MLTRFNKTFIRSALLLAAWAYGTASAQATTITTPTVQVNSLTHTYIPSDPFFPGPPTSRDSFSIGDGNYTGGGAFSVTSIANGDTATIRLQATPGKKFVVSDATAGLGLDLYWQAGGDSASLGGGTVSFEGLVGTEPANTYSFLKVGNAGNVIGATLQWQASTPFEFSAIDITIPVQTSPAAGARNFGLVQSNSEPAFYAFASAVNGDHSVMSLQAPVPEPASLSLVAVVGLGLLLRQRKNRRG